MNFSEIIGAVMVVIALVGLLVLAFMVCIPLAKTENKERQKRTKMYSTITKYIETLLADDVDDKEVGTDEQQKS